MFHWLHHLFNPHCEECREDNSCRSCEVLQRELENERREKQQLIKKLLFPEANITQEVDTEIRPIVPKHVPWGVRRQQYELADRQEAERLRRAKESELQEMKREHSISALESALDIKEN